MNVCAYLCPIISNYITHFILSAIPYWFEATKSGVLPMQGNTLVSTMPILKVWFYIAPYPIRWTAQSALHFSSPGRPVHSNTNSASHGSILAMQQLRNDYSLTFPSLSIARYSFIQLSRLRRREEKENEQTSKRQQRGFEPGLSHCGSGILPLSYRAPPQQNT